MDLRDFLGYFDFDYDIVSPGGKFETNIRNDLIEDGDLTAEQAAKDLICLVDLQGVYLGDIGRERYPIEKASIPKIVDRMDVYIRDTLILDFEEVLEQCGVVHDDMDLEQMVQKCRELGIEPGQVSYTLADAVLDPDSISMAELREPVSLDAMIAGASERMKSQAQKAMADLGKDISIMEPDGR